MIYLYPLLRYNSNYFIIVFLNSGGLNHPPAPTPSQIYERLEYLFMTHKYLKSISSVSVERGGGRGGGLGAPRGVGSILPRVICSNRAN